MSQPRDVYLALSLADQELEKRLPILKHQDALGMFFFLTSFLGMLGVGALYFQGLISGWLAFFANAFLASILHELEHDLIHRQYFSDSKFLQNAMFFGIWVFNGNTINPWYRRKLHLLHHKESGQDIDIEERLLGNGMAWGLKRFLLTVDNTFISVFRLKPLSREIPDFSVKELLRARLPFGVLYTLTWFSFLSLSAIFIFSGHSHFGNGYGALVSFLMVTVVGPNMLRQSSLSFISSNSHYHGIERMNVIQQCQILNHWIFWPAQLFCFNFGSTHIIHHFYVPQAFYRRQLFASEAHKILIEAGVRVNDLKSIAHANHWQPEESEAPSMAATA